MHLIYICDPKMDCIVDPNFNDPSKWSLIKNDWEDVEPSFDSWYARIQNGLLTMYVKDEINWDYGDAGAFQGRVPHGNGSYFKSPLAYEPTLVYPVPANKLVGEILFRKTSSEYPKKVGGFGRWDRACLGQAVAGLDFFICLQLHEAFPEDRWYNYDEPDYWGEPDLGTLEMFNRWFYWGIRWEQSNEWHPCYNFVKRGTTHDSDYHAIRAGWMVPNTDFVLRTVDFGLMFNMFAEILNSQFIVTIDKAIVRAVGITTECYLGEMSYQVEYAHLYWNP